MSVQVGEAVDPQVNKFKQVSSDDHQMSVAGRRGWVPCLVSAGEEVGAIGGCTVRSNTSWVMVTWKPPSSCEQTPVKTLPSRNFVCGRQ